MDAYRHNARHMGAFFEEITKISIKTKIKKRLCSSCFCRFLLTKFFLNVVPREPVAGGRRKIFLE